MPCRTSGHATATSASRLPDRNWLCLAQRSLGSGPASGHEVRATPRVAATSASLPRAEAFARLARTARSENWLRFSPKRKLASFLASTTIFARKRRKLGSFVIRGSLTPATETPAALSAPGGSGKRPLADGGRIAAYRLPPRTRNLPSFLTANPVFSIKNAQIGFV